MDKYLFLENLTKRIPHSGRSFYNHLYGTGLLLYKMGEPEYLCDAGLYHSVYDTESFKANLDISRDKVKQLIGEKAENLVYIFCNLGNNDFYIKGGDRLQILLNNTDIPKDVHIDLLKLEYANLIEQNEGNLGGLVQEIQPKLFTLLYQ